MKWARELRVGRRGSALEWDGTAARMPSAKLMTALFGGLGPRGKMVVVGATMDTLEVWPGQLIQGSRGIHGWASGIPADSEDTLRFAEMTGGRPMVEKYPLEKVNEAFGRMVSGRAQFSRGADHVGGDLGVNTREVVAWRLDFTLNAAGSIRRARDEDTHPKRETCCLGGT
jgi:hypothetical protein